MAEWSLAVPIRLCPLIKYMSTAILYMYSLVFVSWSLLVRYEHVLGSFQIYFQFVMSSIDDLISSDFSANVCVFETVSYFCISSQVVIVLTRLRDECSLFMQRVLPSFSF